MCTFLSYIVGCLSQNWVSNGEYEFFYPGIIASNYESAMTECTEEQATLAMIKSKEIQEFIEAQSWQSKIYSSEKFFYNKRLQIFALYRNQKL